jgi:hypothetical protein
MAFSCVHRQVQRHRAIGEDSLDIDAPVQRAAVRILHHKQVNARHLRLR